MTRDLYDEFEYDVALSFAADDRWIAEKLAAILAAKHIQVLYDELGKDAFSGPEMDMVLHLAEIVRTKARYCVLFLSRSYPLERWTEVERTSVQEHALRDASEYFLLLRLDDREMPGIQEAAGYRDLRQNPVEHIANILERKLALTKGRSAPPAESHDLRSGNVASKRRKG